MSKDKIKKIVEELTRRWQKVDTKLLLPVFPLLAKGQPVLVSRLAELANKEVASIRKALEAAHTEVNNLGEIKELFGVTVKPTRHRIRVKEKELFGCCALVAQMVPHFLGTVVEIQSLDPVTQKTVSIRVSPDGIEAFFPDNAVATLVTVDTVECDMNIASIFCNHVNHFVSVDSANRFVGENSRRFVVGLEELFYTAKKLYSAVWE